MRPLGTSERKIILAAELYSRRSEVPTWTDLQRAVGCERVKFVYVMSGLRAKGLVSFEDDVPGSLRVDPRAVSLALAAGGRRGES